MEQSAIEAYYRGHRPALQGARGAYAVLVPVIRRADGLYLLYEVRAAGMRRHRSEVCFPGGRMEPGESPAACALRETEEELGIPAENIRVLGEADFLHLRSEALMHPVVAEVREESLTGLRLSPAEVSDTFLVPIRWLRENPPAVYRYPLIPAVDDAFPYAAVQTPPDYRWDSGSMEVPVYNGLPYPLWGLTARITMHFIENLAAVPSGT